MIIQHSLIYLFARGLPAVLNFLSLVIFSRLVSPEEYGQYALVVASVSMADVLLYGWLKLGLLRYLPSFKDREDVFLSTTLAAFIVLALTISALGLIFAAFQEDIVTRKLIIIAVGILWVQGWYGLNLELVRSRLMPKRYGLMSLLKAAIALLAGCALSIWGMGSLGLILGLGAGMLIGAISQTFGGWQYVSYQKVNFVLLHKLLRYGVPLSGTLAMTYVINSSDRFLLAWMVDADSVGAYAVGYDLVQRALGVIMTIVNLASYPLIIKANETLGQEATRDELKKNALLLMALGIPCAIILIMLSKQIVGVFLGEPYRQTALLIMPWIVIAVLLSSAKSKHTDIGFQLAGSTKSQLYIISIAAAANLILNYLLIPSYGVMGASIATVVAYVVGFTLSLLLGKKVFPVPGPPKDGLKILAAGLGMILSLWPLMSFRVYWGSLFLQIVVGLVAYTIVLTLLNTCGCRRTLSQYFAWNFMSRE